MPLQLRRRNGSVTPFRNSEYIPFYYFIPKSILKKCGAELNAVPRNPREIFSNRKVCEFIESDLFLLLIIDAAAYLVWPHMGHKEYMEVYSGYDPAWKLAHCPDYWIKELTDAKILPTANDLYKMADTTFGYVSEEEIGAHLQYIVPQAMERYNMNAAIAVAEEFRCFEDFDLRKSRQKTDFYRKWYHTRTKHPIVSLEALKENYAESHNGQEWEEPDSGIDIEEAVTSQVLVDQFKATLDKLIQVAFEKNVLGTLRDDLFERMTANYEQEQRELMQSVAELEHRLANAEQDNIDLRAFLSIIRKCTDLQELTPELVNRLITKIEVFASTKDENGKKHIPIKVHFIGVGILEIPDTQTIIDAKEEIRKNPPKVA